MCTAKRVHELDLGDQELNGLRIARLVFLSDRGAGITLRPVPGHNLHAPCYDVLDTSPSPGEPAGCEHHDVPETSMLLHLPSLECVNFAHHWIMALNMRGSTV